MPQLNKPYPHKTTLCHLKSYICHGLARTSKGSLVVVNLCLSTNSYRTDNCPRPEGRISTTPVPSMTGGIALQSFDRRSVDLRSDDSGSDEPDMTMRSKISHRVRRWSKTFDEGLRSKGNDIVVMIFKVEKLSWIEKHFTYYRVHAAYFILLGTVGTVTLYLLPLSTSKRLSVVDAMYTSFSVLCGIGFQTISSQDLKYTHAMVIWLLMNMGAPVPMSLLPLYIRRLYFNLCIKQNAKDVVNDFEPSRVCGSLANLKACKVSHDGERQGVSSESHLQHLDVYPNVDSPQVTTGRSIFPQAKNLRNDRGDRGEDEEGSRVIVDTREALQTLEYRALMAIDKLVLGYFVGVQLIGFVVGVLYLRWSPNDTRIITGKDTNPTFYAFFTSTASFSNSGYYLTNDSMLAFQKSSFLLILYSILPLLGNTLYPPFLRLLVWICHKASNENQRPVYKYLLTHPRRCFICLFPRAQTMWLVVAFIAFTSVQLIFICSLEWNKAFAGMNTVQKLVVGFFQAASNRSSGGTVVNLDQLAPAILFLFVVMMYISAYPTFLSLQTSNDVNSYDDAELVAVPHDNLQTNTLNKWGNVIVAQSRGLLARDTSYLVVAILILCLSESQSIKQDPLNFSIFNIVFEVISAYGSIGLSIGYHCELRRDVTLPCKDVTYSFSGTWSLTGKVVLVVVMLCGRHRGLPDDIDSAIRLPARPLTRTLSHMERAPNDASSLPQPTALSNQDWKGSSLYIV